MPALCDLVLPCRTKDRPAWSAAHHPRDLRGDRRRQRLDRRHGRGRPLRSGRRVVAEPRPGYGAAVHAGLEAATARLRRGDGRRRLVRPRRPACRCSTTCVAGGADLAVGRRRPVAPRRVALARPRRQRGWSLWWLRRRIGMPVHDIAPMRVCRREDLLALGRRGPALRLPRRAAAAGDRRRLAVRRARHRLPPARGRHAVQGLRLGARHVRAARDFARVLAMSTRRPGRGQGARRRAGQDAARARGRA